MEQSGMATVAKTKPEETVYKATARTPEALVIRCSDNRLQPGLSDFLRRWFGLISGEYVDLSVPGGLMALSGHASSFFPESVFLPAAVELQLKKAPSINVVIGINHDDCKKYEELYDKFGESSLLRGIHRVELGKDHAVEAISRIQELAPRKIGVHSFFARFSPDSRSGITFEML